MSELMDLSSYNLTSKEIKAVTTFCNALNSLDINIKSITLYGSVVSGEYRPGKSDINLLIVLEHINIAILKKLLNPVTKAKNYRISPFCITYANLISSSDVFPVKFLSMQWSYKVLWGSDVLGELKISREHIRLRCEQEIKNLLLSLTRFYLFQIDRTLTKTIYRTYKFFLECLRVLVSLKQGDLPSHSEVIDVAERTLDLDTEVLHKIKTLRKSNKSLSDKEVEQLYDELISILNKAAQIADKIG